MAQDKQALTPEDVISFWFSEEAKAKWFEPDDAFDNLLRERFGAASEEAQFGVFDGWADSAEGALALVLLLDQMPRNIHRGTRKAFTGDEKALAVAGEALAKGLDAPLTPDQRNFLFMPFMHSERLEDQERGLVLFERKNSGDGLKFMRLHRDIVARFGRFPHRNAVLGRKSTPEELAFLQQPGSRF